MGRVVAELADRAILTSDNPRSEDPAAIAAEVAAGALGELELELDRRAAIERALGDARAGRRRRDRRPRRRAGAGARDGGKIPFDDREVAREMLRGVAARRDPARARPVEPLGRLTRAARGPTR